MNLEQIKEAISNYEKLIALAKAKIGIMEKIDNVYRTSRGIERISFDEDYVDVTCDNSCRGCYDTIWFQFPVSWLAKTDTELEETVRTEREMREEKERKDREEKTLLEKQKAEQQELEQYKKLKAKFEQ